MTFLALKKAPILSSVLHMIILNCWRERRIPSIWKRGVTVLIYKKGDTSDPANYRPITLQNCWYKIFSKVYSSSIFDFLSKNKFIDTEYQKGFWRGIDGVLEHTEVLEQMMKCAKKERRNIIICLLDLKNAFGEVPHALLKSTLLHHHLPPEIIEIFNSIYTDNTIQVSMKNNLTPPPSEWRGVFFREIQLPPSSSTSALIPLCMSSSSPNISSWVSPMAKRDTIGRGLGCSLQMIL